MGLQVINSDSWQLERASPHLFVCPPPPPAVAAHCSAVCSPLVLLCGSADMPLLSHGQLSRLDDTTASCPRLGIKALFITWCLQYQPIQMDGQLCSSSVAAKSAAARPAPAAAAKQLQFAQQLYAAAAAGLARCRFRGGML